MTFLGNQGTTVAPLVRQIVERFLALEDLAPVVFNGQSPVLADVAEVSRNRGHATPASSHLDHHLRCTLPYRRDDPSPDHRRLAARQYVQARRLRRLDDPVRRV